MKKTIVIYIILLLHAISMIAQSDFEYRLQGQYSVSDGQTPLWLNANKYGVSSLDKYNGYIRAGVFRSMDNDSVKKLAWGIGADVAVAQGFTSTFLVQQAYVEGRWLHGVLSVGSREYPMELKNSYLSSGSQTLGINARPVPQVRIALPDYWTIPLTRGLLGIKGHIAYGMMTDDNWQKSFTGSRTRYAENVLYHSKAGYLRIKDSRGSFPFYAELGLEMASTFGGTSHVFDVDGSEIIYKNEGGIKGMWHAFLPGTSGDASDGAEYYNSAGNSLGSWVARLTYEAPKWMVSVYADKYFDDQSQMFNVSYNGFGIGDEWLTKKDNRYFFYSLKDIMLGAEFKLKHHAWLDDIVVEYLYTKYQSGPIYHDHTPQMSDNVTGLDDYYNHYLYGGWEHWGQVIGNPLYRSPIYNTDGQIYIENNRFWAWHLGLAGTPSDAVEYRILATYQKGWGTYSKPFLKSARNVSLLAELTYSFWRRKDFLRGLGITAAIGYDNGEILGNNVGGQLTFTYTGFFK